MLQRPEALAHVVRCPCGPALPMRKITAPIPGSKQQTQGGWRSQLQDANRPRPPCGVLQKVTCCERGL